MSVPSGYEPQSENSVPLIWGPVTPGEEACEQVDFELVEAPGQDDFDLLVLADIHLANRLGDIAQYKELMLPEVKNYIAASPRKVYIMNVGDMTWVKVMNVDDRGRIDLSRKDAMREKGLM